MKNLIALITRNRAEFVAALAYFDEVGLDPTRASHEKDIDVCFERGDNVYFYYNADDKDFFIHCVEFSEKLVISLYFNELKSFTNSIKEDVVKKLTFGLLKIGERFVFPSGVAVFGPCVKIDDQRLVRMENGFVGGYSNMEQWPVRKIKNIKMNPTYEVVDPLITLRKL